MSELATPRACKAILMRPAPSGGYFVGLIGWRQVQTDHYSTRPRAALGLKLLAKAAGCHAVRLPGGRDDYGAGARR